MARTKDFLIELLDKRLGRNEPGARRFFEHASEVIVFGSMSVGLDRPDSDLDVLCIGTAHFKLKTGILDLIIVPADSTEDKTWLESELASHIGAYGTWIKGTSTWKNRVRVGREVVLTKQRRIRAFMRSLPESWLDLEECFRIKYSTKLRRETQRLLLLERGVPVPPTRILDTSWADLGGSPLEVCDRLRKYSAQPKGDFVFDLLARVDGQIRSNEIAT